MPKFRSNGSVDYYYFCLENADREVGQPREDRAQVVANRYFEARAGYFSAKSRSWGIVGQGFLRDTRSVNCLLEGSRGESAAPV
jgi:hypothetical protein